MTEPPTPPAAAGLPEAPLGGLPRYGKSVLTPEQKRRQRLLIGCVGTVLLALLVGAGAVGFWAVGNAKKFMYTGPVDSQTMQAKIGGDVPLYPNGQIDEMGTRAGAVGASAARGLGAAGGGVQPVATVALNTPDSRDEVLAHYRKVLGEQGWQEQPTTSIEIMGMRQSAFVKDREHILMIQVRPRQDRLPGTMIMLQRMKMGGDPKGSSTEPMPSPY